MAPRHSASSAGHPDDWRAAMEGQDLLLLLKRNPASARRAVLSFPVVLAEEGAECPICFDEAGPESAEHPEVGCGWRKLPCGHAFHEACLCELMVCSHRSQCPLCRMDFSAKPKSATTASAPQGQN